MKMSHLEMKYQTRKSHQELMKELTLNLPHQPKNPEVKPTPTKNKEPVFYLEE
jgi:hypothetical protein